MVSFIILFSALSGSPSFRAFGPLRYARITLDHETGRSRGTGFVCFWNIEDADMAIEKSDLLRLETTGSAPTVRCTFFEVCYGADVW